MELNIGKTARGFAIIEFDDFYGDKCSLQKSSLATTECIWLGIDKAEPKIMANSIIEGGVGWAKYPIPNDVMISTRMHLSREQVRDLIPILQTFVDTGNLPDN